MKLGFLSCSYFFTHFYFFDTLEANVVGEVPDTCMLLSQEPLYSCEMLYFLMGISEKENMSKLPAKACLF